jgi:hypothetical protein
MATSSLPKLFPARLARGASPTLRKRRRLYYATQAFRAQRRGDTKMARAYVSFALNNGARLADLARAGRDAAPDDGARDAWLKLLQDSPQFSERSFLLKLGRQMAARKGLPPVSELDVDIAAGDTDAARLQHEADVEALVVSAVSAQPATTDAAYGAADATYYSPLTQASTKSKYPGKSTRDNRKNVQRAQGETDIYYWDGSQTVYLRQPYVTGSDWRSVAADPNKCLFAARKDEKGRPIPPLDAKHGTEAFDLWVSALCSYDSRDAALELEAERLAVMQVSAAGLNAAVGKMLESMRESARQQNTNLDAAFKGLPLPYPAPPKNLPETSNLYVLPPNHAVPGLPVNPSSWKGEWATKGPPAPAGAVAGQIYTAPAPTPVVTTQQVVDPVTGQVATVQQSTTTPTEYWPGGPAVATYPTTSSTQTYPGYTPPPPPAPVEEDVEKKKRKKSSMTLPLVLGVGALGVGALVVLKSRRG